MIAADLGALLSNVTRFGSNADLVFRALENRAALAALELEEARHRFLSVACGIVLTGMMLLMAGVTATAIVAAIYWDTPHRTTSLIILGAIEIVVVAAGICYVRSQWKRWQLFELSRQQLAKDSACLREILSTKTD